MSWIDDRIAERQALEERALRTYSEAPKLHGELWKELMAQLDDAKRKGFRIMMVTSDEVLLPVNPAAGQSSASPRKLALRLSADHSSIIAKIDGNDLVLVPVATGSGVSLTYDNKSLTVSDAAVLILDRFLFPELDRLDLHKINAWKGL